MDQSKYLRDIMAKHGMTGCKPSSLPMDPGFVSGLARMDSPPLTGVAKDVYPNLLGSLQYAAVYTHPDVSTALIVRPPGSPPYTEEGGTLPSWDH
jgi:hypothetical protein